MSTHETKNDDEKCQIHSVPRMAEQGAMITTESSPLSNRLKLAMKRILGTSTKRRIKANINKLTNWLSGFSVGTRALKNQVTAREPQNLKAGDWVRIRSKEEIKATLDHWNELKGCGFMDDMWPFCGTTHRVLKRVERFVDERDYTVKRVNGVVLLEGIICQGTKLYGRCDRACFFFWREEWLEKAQENNER